MGALGGKLWALLSAFETVSDTFLSSCWSDFSFCLSSMSFRTLVDLTLFQPFDSLKSLSFNPFNLFVEW